MDAMEEPHLEDKHDVALCGYHFESRVVRALLANEFMLNSALLPQLALFEVQSRIPLHNLKGDQGVEDDLPPLQQLVMLFIDDIAMHCNDE